MRSIIRIVGGAALAAAVLFPSQAALNIPSDGSDGDLVITQDTVIDLSKAYTGRWDAASAVPGDGVYDPVKWAVVFKYSSVTIQGGATITFQNHPSRAPVVWLVKGDVTINGTVSLNGQDGLPAPGLAEPGPGGFRGGAGRYGPGALEAAGFGPGGGGFPGWSEFWGSGGSYGSLGAKGKAIYGNSSLIPLVGGSGGGGGFYEPVEPPRGGGGAGGGAILVACAKRLLISGAIRANGGNGDLLTPRLPHRVGGGSGGAIRLVCDEFIGAGDIEAIGGREDTYRDTVGGLGRIRIERTSDSFAGKTVPTSPSLVNLADGATPLIWLPSDGPTVRIVSIEGQVAPADPRAGFGTIGADIVLPQVTNVTVVVETTNVEPASVVRIRATPRANGNFTETTNTTSQIVSEDPLVIRWTGNVPVQDGYAAIQAHVVRP